MNSVSPIICGIKVHASRDTGTMAQLQCNMTHKGWAPTSRFHLFWFLSFFFFFLALTKDPEECFPFPLLAGVYLMNTNWLLGIEERVNLMGLPLLHTYTPIFYSVNSKQSHWDQSFRTRRPQPPISIAPKLTTSSLWRQSSSPVTHCK